MSKIIRAEFYKNIYTKICKAVTGDGGKIKHGVKLVRLLEEMTKQPVDLAVKINDLEDECARLRALIQSNELERLD